VNAIIDLYWALNRREFQKQIRADVLVRIKSQGRPMTSRESPHVEKAELHCHLDGLVNPRMLAELKMRGLGAEIDPGALAAVVPVRSVEQWLGNYGAVVAPSLTPPERLGVHLEIHIGNLIRQHVLYAEIMVSGMLLPPEGEPKVLERFEGLRKIADHASRGVIRIELVVAIGRGPRERAQRQAEQILALRRAGLICGVAIAGDESACTIGSMADLLDDFRDAGLGIEIHAGEFAGPESVWDALTHGRPDRIGHGVRAFEDGHLLDELRRRDVHLEFCLSSNVCLGVVPDIRQHPVALAKKLGMNFSVNTDDPGPFGCDLESEFGLLEKELGFGPSDFDLIRANAWRSRFGGPAEG
jgi:adenosine deaminase